MNAAHRHGAAALAGLSASALLAAAQAAPLTLTQQVGTLDPGCISETASCAADQAFMPSFGGYRAGGEVSWMAMLVGLAGVAGAATIVRRRS